MNIFSKTELKIMLDTINDHAGKDLARDIDIDVVLGKIKHLLDNFCEHNETYEDYDLQPTRCRSCFKILD